MGWPSSWPLCRPGGGTAGLFFLGPVLGRLVGGLYANARPFLWLSGDHFRVGVGVKLLFVTNDCTKATVSGCQPYAVRAAPKDFRPTEGKADIISNVARKPYLPCSLALSASKTMHATRSWADLQGSAPAVSLGTTPAGQRAIRYLRYPWLVHKGVLLPASGRLRAWQLPILPHKIWPPAGTQLGLHLRKP